jgi:hypothetical protein
MKVFAVAAALCLSFACATTTSSGTAATAAAGSCAPAIVSAGITVYSRPDGNSDPVASINDRTQVCAESKIVGFGYRHVKLANGKEGYVIAEGLI